MSHVLISNTVYACRKFDIDLTKKDSKLDCEITEIWMANLKKITAKR